MSELSITKYFPFMRVRITGQNVHHQDASSAMIKLSPDLRYRPVCHDCKGLAATVHSRQHYRLVQDLNMANAKVWLQVEYRKIWCNICDGVRVELLTFCDACRRVTYRLARYIYQLCKMLTVKDVAEHLDLDPKTVKEIDKGFLEEAFGTTDYEGLSVLLIDEIALHKGHSYMTVVADYFSGRVVWMGYGRKKETLDEFFMGMTVEQRQAIDAVAIDMWEPYINRVQHYCPQAHIVFDFFHLVQSFSRVIDNIRRTEYLNARKEDRKILKGSRYLLLKNEENLTCPQRSRLKEILELNTTLSIVYVLKDQLKLLFHYDKREHVKQALDDWCRMAEQIDHPGVRGFVKRLKFFEYGIISHADYPIGTSMLEGINNKIKVIKRKAYGFHDCYYFALKVKQAFAT